MPGLVIAHVLPWAGSGKLRMFGPDIWWLGSNLKWPGSAVQALQMASNGTGPSKVFGRGPKS